MNNLIQVERGCMICSINIWLRAVAVHFSTPLRLYQPYACATDTDGEGQKNGQKLTHQSGEEPSEFFKTLILMQHEGSFHLDDIRHLQSDEALGSVLNLNRLPKATTLGDWLRRMGRQPQMRDAWVKVNQSLLQSALHCCKKVTLDIDATEIVAHKADAQWTYKKNRGFMPMVGHIAETGQVVAVDFCDGNVPPAQNNLAFIQQCRQSLPDLITHQFQLSRLISNRRKNNGLHWLFHRVASLHCQIWPKSTLVCIIKNPGLPMSAGLDATKLGCLVAEDGG